MKHISDVLTTLVNQIVEQSSGLNEVMRPPVIRPCCRADAMCKNLLPRKSTVGDFPRSIAARDRARGMNERLRL